MHNLKELKIDNCKKTAKNKTKGFVAARCLVGHITMYQQERFFSTSRHKFSIAANPELHLLAKPNADMLGCTGRKRLPVTPSCDDDSKHKLLVMHLTKLQSFIKNI